jgi:hypothetical protein
VVAHQERLGGQGVPVQAKPGEAGLLERWDEWGFLGWARFLEVMQVDNKLEALELGLPAWVLHLHRRQYRSMNQ